MSAADILFVTILWLSSMVVLIWIGMSVERIARK